jgi:hypothetical protein
MQVRGIDRAGNWIHLAPPTRNFVAAEFELYERIREVQRTALAVRAEQEMNAAY